MSSKLVGIGLAACSIAVIAVGCATGTVAFEGDDDSSGGAAAQGGSGGQTSSAGGAMASSSSGNPSPCAIDCTTIATPNCQVAQCNEVTKQCEVVDDANGTPCDDGMFCSVDEVCTDGICGGGTANDCGISAPACTEVSCDEAAKSCGTQGAMDGSPCSPTDLCQVNATCSNGLCLGIEKDCFFAPVPNECHVAKCNPMNGMCEPEPGNENAPCIDQNDLCTDGKLCTNGSCVGGAPKDCSAFTQGCFDGKCDAINGQCFGDPIQPGQPCAAATDDCNAGSCDMQGKCVGTPTNEGLTCNDGLACTSGETCQTGVCTGGMANITVFLYEDFSAGVAGWTADNEWAIGPTKTSTGHIYGGPDPATDHTVANMDNRIAGVVLGGNAATVQHGYAYMTSPVVDTSQAQTVYFEFWRWLNSDYTPFMQNIVEVYDGTTWQVLWQSGSSPGIQDNAWQKITHDLINYKNAAMQVRFGFQITSNGVFTVSQWNLDDVLIASGPCL